MSIGGAEAFARYVRHTLPYLRDSGGDVVFLGAGGLFLIGPANGRWDMAMLVRQASRASFFDFASHEGYLAGLGQSIIAMIN